MTTTVKNFIQEYSMLIEKSMFDSLFYVAYRHKLPKIHALELREALVTAGVASDTELKQVLAKLFVSAIESALKTNHLHLRNYDSFRDEFYIRSANQGIALTCDEMLDLLIENKTKLQISVRKHHQDASIFYYGDF